MSRLAQIRKQMATTAEDCRGDYRMAVYMRPKAAWELRSEVYDLARAIDPNAPAPPVNGMKVYDMAVFTVSDPDHPDVRVVAVPT